MRSRLPLGQYPTVHERRTPAANAPVPAGVLSSPSVGLLSRHPGMWRRVCLCGKHYTCACVASTATGSSGAAPQGLVAQEAAGAQAEDRVSQPDCASGTSAAVRACHSPVALEGGVGDHHAGALRIYRASVGAHVAQKRRICTHAGLPRIAAPSRSTLSSL